jgi:hypothetical protein
MLVFTCGALLWFNLTHDGLRDSLVIGNKVSCGVELGYGDERQIKGHILLLLLLSKDSESCKLNQFISNYILQHKWMFLYVSFGLLNTHNGQNAEYYTCCWVVWGFRSLNAAFPCWSWLPYFNKIGQTKTWKWKLF